VRTKLDILFFLFVFTFLLRVVMSVRIFAYKRCSIHPFPKLFVGGLMSYLCCLCLFAYSGVQNVVLLYVSTFLVPCCDVFYDFRIKMMFGSSFLRVVC
jgi:hypothetical protein